MTSTELQPNLNLPCPNQIQWPLLLLFHRQDLNDSIAVSCELPPRYRLTDDVVEAISRLAGAQEH